MKRTRPSLFLTARVWPEYYSYIILTTKGKKKIFRKLVFPTNELSMLYKVVLWTFIFCITATRSIQWFCRNYQCGCEYFTHSHKSNTFVLFPHEQNIRNSPQRRIFTLRFTQFHFLIWTFLVLTVLFLLPIIDWSIDCVEPCKSWSFVLVSLYLCLRNICVEQQQPLCLCICMCIFYWCRICVIFV